LLPACAGDDGREPTAETTAPPQETARLVAVRVRAGPPPYFNPPRFDLLTMSEDGSSQRLLVKAPATREIRLLRLSSPAWSADGRWIYFTGVVEERETERFTYYLSDVFAVRSDGTGLRRLTDTGDASAPVPSPDGEAILFSRNEHQARFPPTSGLWLMEPHGGGQRRLLGVRDGWVDVPGSWSPDGKTIAFTRCRRVPPGPEGRTQNTCTVRIVARTGSDVRQLAARATAPVYSRDGRRIAFLTDRDEHGIHRTGSDESDFANELYVMEADGRDPERVTHTEELDEEAASWSPDDDRLAYGREGPASFARQVMIVNADGSCATRIAGNGAASDPLDAEDYEQPAWRPGRITGPRSTLDC
jgi:Tol biopolymer transport system component